jgi:hypothetical protein
MSNKIKKSSETVSFSLSRWFRKMATNTPVPFLVTVVGMAYAIFLFGGGLYTLITGPPTAQYYNNQFIFLAPGASYQYVSDTIISVILYALGFVGLMAIYQSTKSAYKPRQAYILLITGVTFVLISYIFLEGAISFKSSYG